MNMDVNSMVGDQGLNPLSQQMQEIAEQDSEEDDGFMKQEYYPQDGEEEVIEGQQYRSSDAKPVKDSGGANLQSEAQLR